MGAVGMKTIKATYLVETEEPKLALKAICRGQSIGNPGILTNYETKQFLDKWQAFGKIDKESHEGLFVMHIEFPKRNFGLEGVNYVLSVIMGGQCDIDIIKGCRLIELDLCNQDKHWAKPRYGLKGIREKLGVYNRPMLCGIIKPKIGLKPNELANLVSQMIDGGCDLIKEDEILSNQYWCSLNDRLNLITKLIKDKDVIYLACITGDGSEVWKKARLVKELGGNGIHLNIWCGLGTYLDVRRHVDIPLFFQKSGDKVWTTGSYSIDYSVLCKLINSSGCDFAHVGMYGGYLAEEISVLKRRIVNLASTIPSFSCGMNPSLAEKIISIFGNDLMITSGGWIHGQSEGVEFAVKQMRKAIDASVKVTRV